MTECRHGLSEDCPACMQATIDDLRAQLASAAQAALGPCTQAEIDAFEGLDSKSKQLFSMWVDRALKAEEALANSHVQAERMSELQYEAGMYQSLYEAAKKNLNGRDDFIVSKSLWSEFTSSLPSTSRATPMFETKEEADEAADNGRNTGGKSYV